MPVCELCAAKAQFRDRAAGSYLCLEHARLEVVAPSPTDEGGGALAVRRATASDLLRIAELARYFWDETVVDCFDRQYDVLACPAFLVEAGAAIVGLASYAVEAAWDAWVLVMLSVLPDYQGRGGGRALLDAVRDEALRKGVGRLVVATSNDDLPALALYQRYGFRLAELLPGRIAQHHGGEFPGFGGIPVRDEVRLAYEMEGP
jgi:ribosomal protein S18 acetylase RimI-like enzyme